jgi:recombination protein RecA
MSNTDNFASKMNKAFGAGSVMRLGSSTKVQVGAFSTGSLGLDAATGIGGYPFGKISLLLGDPMSGKTTLALTAAREVQKLGKQVLYIDAEHALDIDYAKSIGVDIDNLWINQPDYGEQALRIAEEALRSSEFGLVVVDSVAALVPKKELDGEVGDAQVGLQARMMSQTCRKFVATAHTSNTALLFINQYRANIATTGFGGPTKVAPGGKALDYFSSLTLVASRIQTIKDDNVSVANRTRVEVKKNKFAPPYRVAEFDLSYGVGIDSMSEYVDLASMLGVITKKGSWYQHNDENIGQGKQSAIRYLSENPDALAKILLEIKGFLFNEQKV